MLLYSTPFYKTILFKNISLNLFGDCPGPANVAMSSSMLVKVKTQITFIANIQPISLLRQKLNNNAKSFFRLDTLTGRKKATT